ncbi:hypothetical protein CQ054_20085 [Ochrobactrum sp. MYb29]|nr:hypothetical protein CQ054_20085 [Ochrobactrum sp. MYb29]
MVMSLKLLDLQSFNGQYQLFPPIGGPELEIVVVVNFKMHAGASAAVYEITKDIVEETLGRREPWFRKGQVRDSDRHYAVCPYCDNPIQLKGLYPKRDNSSRPHGSHTGKPQQGFPHFNQLDLQFCPYKIASRSHDKNSRRQMGEAAQLIIELAINEFDRIVYLLRKDFGFQFSEQFAGNMLDSWFEAKGYLYTGAHLRNLPWMVAYFGPTQSLYRQYVGLNETLTSSIRSRVEGAVISEQGQFSCLPEKWRRLDLQCYHHSATLDDDTGKLTERMKLRVQDFTNTNDPTEAPLIYSKIVTFDPDAFERLIRTRVKNPYRNQSLLEIANTIAQKWRFR